MKKIIALLLATLMLASLFACGEKKNETDNEQSGVEDEIPNDDANKEETDYTKIPDSDKMIVCYVEHESLSQEPNTVVKVSYAPADTSVISAMRYSYKVNGDFPYHFSTNSIIEKAVHDDLSNHSASLICIKKLFKENNYDMLAHVSFIGKRELNDEEKATAFTTKNGYTCYKVSNHYNQFKYYVLDIGLANYYVHVEQCNTSVDNYGTEFQDLKFEIILDK